MNGVVVTSSPGPLLHITSRLRPSRTKGPGDDVGVVALDAYKTRYLPSLILNFFAVIFVVRFPRNEEKLFSPLVTNFSIKVTRPERVKEVRKR